MHPDFKDYLLSCTRSSDCEEVELIQSLWSGYGSIKRYRLKDSLLDTVVVKHISLIPTHAHPRGWNSPRSHERKVRSYQVETHWYMHWNRQCGNSCRTAEYLGSYATGKEQWIILEDLDTQFPLRKHQLKIPEVKVCLSWLAHFHATFMGQTPDGLWEVGTYWHLDTRPDELEQMVDQELKAKAGIIDERLKQCRYQTIVHGDAKLANFCFSDTATAVAAVDYQYVGRGCGMKDVTYFMGSCLSSAECIAYQEALLDSYFGALEKALEKTGSTIDFSDLTHEWRALYPIAWTDFTRFLLGWMPTHQKVNEYSLRLMESALGRL